MRYFVVLSVFLSIRLVYTRTAISSSHVQSLQDILTSFTDRKCIHYDPIQCYDTHSEMHSKLTEFAFDYPHLIDFFDIGTSVNGLNLLAVRITNKHNVDPLKPKVRYIGNMHGDEALSRQLLIKLIIYLVEHYESDWNVYQILNTTEVYILPTMNPDGYANSDEGTCLPSSYKIAGPYTRHNANGIDLNRDFPVLSRKPITRCQPETRAVIEWAKSLPFLLSANFHGGALLVSYPLDFLFYNGSSDCSDNDLVENIAKIYADNHRGGMAEGFRCNPNDPGYITNGADWYPLYGSMQDYFYFHSTAIDITVELSCCKYPISGKLQQYWMDNKDSFLEFILAAHMGIKGYVIDSVTGEPIQNAVITANKSKDTVSSKDGLFWKLLLPGTYRVKVMASGYNPNVSLIRVKNDNKQSAEIINYWLNPVIHAL